MNIVSLFVFSAGRNPHSPSYRRLLQRCVAFAAVLGMGACAVGPDYHKPAVQIPESFKEGADWQRAQANPQASLASDWWRMYHDDKLTELIEQSAEGNQSIAASEAAYSAGACPSCRPTRPPCSRSSARSCPARAAARLTTRHRGSSTTSEVPRPARAYPACRTTSSRAYRQAGSSICGAPFAARSSRQKEARRHPMHSSPASGCPSQQASRSITSSFARPMWTFGC